MLLASADGVALDATFARLVGVKPRDVFTTRIAGERGLGEVDYPPLVGIACSRHRPARGCGLHFLHGGTS